VAAATSTIVSMIISVISLESSLGNSSDAALRDHPQRRELTSLAFYTLNKSAFILNSESG
jgi:hypothetical protein